MQYSIQRNQNGQLTWLNVGAHPRVDRDINGMFSGATYAAVYETEAAAKSVVTTLTRRGIDGLSVCPRPVVEGPHEDVSHLIDED